MLIDGFKLICDNCLASKFFICVSDNIFVRFDKMIAARWIRGRTKNGTPVHFCEDDSCIIALRELVGDGSVEILPPFTFPSPE